MAYGTQNTNKYNNKSTYSTNKQTTATQSAGSKPTFRTGLFTPDREGAKAMAGVQVKEDVVIKAGSYINIYKNEDKKSDASPDFTLTVKTGVLKQK